MGNRRKRGEKKSMFGGLDPTEDMLDASTVDEAVDDDFEAFAMPTASDAADEIFGTQVGHDDPLAAMGRGQIKAKPKPIADITPDRSQPRRAIPSAVRHYWAGTSDAEAIANLFRFWLKEVELERRGKLLDIDAYLDGKATERGQQADAQESRDDALDQISTNKIKPLESALLKVVDLAASIRRDGLLNPISVVQRGDKFEIETGERRWLAYQLLFWRRGDEPSQNDGIDRTWSQIPARVVPHLSIWRQASENNARADLNAIGLARQFSLLLMDLRREVEDDNFQPFDTFEHEQAFYAQVEDGNRYRVPRGHSERLMNAMGISHAGQLRHIRRLLRIPQATWVVADDLDWSESFIQKEILQNADEAEALRRTVRFAQAEGYDSVSTLTVPEEILSEAVPEKQAKSIKEAPDKILKNNLNWLLRNATQVTDLSAKDRNKATERIAELRSWLDQLESQLQS